jgi:hypothetical protein
MKYLATHLKAFIPIIPIDNQYNFTDNARRIDKIRA